MPIYEYLCESCGKVNERLQKVSDPPPARCDECGSKKLAKLVSRSAFQLKGGGWYSDLYATPKKKDGGGAVAEGGASKPAAGDAAPASATATAGAGGDAKLPAAPAKPAPAPGEKKKAGAAPTGSGPASGKRRR
jgi:putative FmdB family regulatory protein